MHRAILVILLIKPGLLFAQPELTKLTEMQNIFFVSEASGLASASYNPAAMSMLKINDGVILGYDFDDRTVQGNSSVFISMSNLGLSYQDVYNINNVRLQNYAATLSIGNRFISIGTINRYTVAKYPAYELEKFNIDAGIILRPAEFLSIGLIGRNLGEVSIDSLNYNRNYTAGIGLNFFNRVLNLYIDADFNDTSKFENLTGTLGLVLLPLDIFEFRGGITFNPYDLVENNGESINILELKYQAFVSATFFIQSSMGITAAVRFNDKGEQTRLSAVVVFPF